MRFELNKQADLRSLYELYAARVRAANADKFTKLQYAFDTYSNGELITMLERRIYLQKRHEFDEHDPFAATQDTFWSRSRKKGIRSPKHRQQNMTSEEIEGKYSSQFAAIHFVLRIVLRVIGPNLYVRFAKYLREQMSLVNQTFLIE